MIFRNISYTFRVSCNHSIIVITGPPLIPPYSILAYWDLDPLCSETLAQVRTLNHSRKLLCTKDVENIAKAGGQDRRGGGVEGLRRAGRTNVDKIHLESRWVESIRKILDNVLHIDKHGCLPK